MFQARVASFKKCQRRSLSLHVRLLSPRARSEMLASQGFFPRHANTICHCRHNIEASKRSYGLFERHTTRSAKVFSSLALMRTASSSPLAVSTRHGKTSGWRLGTQGRRKRHLSSLPPCCMSTAWGHALHRVRKILAASAV